MTKLPDFQALFFATFGGKPRRQRFRLRFDSNLPHDIHFLGSLVHDARLHPSQVSLRGASLRLPIHRDCWEYGLKHHGKTAELHVARSLLRLSPVNRVEWTRPQWRIAETDPELWLRSIYRAEDWWDEEREGFSLILLGHDWRARVHFKSHEPRVALEDQEVPYLLSERSGASGRGAFYEGDSVK